MILNALFDKRATVTGGGDPRTPQYWLQKLFGGGQDTIAGVDVSPDTALQFSAVWCGVAVHANLVKTLPLHTHQRVADDKVRKAREHPAYTVLHRRFNPTMSAGEAMQYMEQCRWLWGSGYAEIVFDGRSKLAELYPIHPSRVRPFYDNGGNIWYEVSNGRKNTQTVFLPNHKMFRVKLYPEDGLETRSVIDAAAQSVGLSLAAERYGASFFGNDARPGGVLSQPGGLNKEQYERMEEGLVEWSKPGKRFTTMIAEGGATYTPVTLPNDAVQFLETRKFNVTDWARWFRTQPYTLMDFERATFNNIEESSINFMADTAEPDLCEWEDEAWMKLFSEEDLAAGYFAEFNRNARLRGDSESRGAFYKVMFEMGAFSPNDILAKENMNSIGSEGDKRFVQLNLTTLKKAGEEEPEKGPPPGDNDDDDDDSERVTDAFRSLAREAVLRLRRKERRWLKTNAAKLDADGALDFFKRHEPMVYEALGSVVDAVCRAMGADSTREPCDSYIKETRDLTLLAVAADGIDTLLGEWTDKDAEERADYLFDKLMEGLKPCQN